MLDVTRFLNSNDIADYWRKIGFDKKCTPKQAAFIIWNSRKIPLKEKFEAWQQLIKTTIDCPVAAGRRRLNIGLSDAVSNSLHKFLGVYIALLKELIVEFMVLVTMRCTHTGHTATAIKSGIQTG